MGSYEEYQKLVESLPVWTQEQYNEEFKTRDLCIENYGEDGLYENEEDYFDDLDMFDTKDIPGVVESSKCIKVYEKDRFRIDPEKLKERICDFAYDNYYMEDTDRVAGLELVDEFCEKFNKLQDWYTTGKMVAKLDMSEQVKEYYLDSEGIPKEKWEETYQEWIKEYNEDMERIRKEVASGVN